MKKIFSCGHQDTVMPWKDARVIKVSFTCIKCRMAQVVQVHGSVEHTKQVRVGNRTFNLVFNACVAKR